MFRRLRTRLKALWGTELYYSVQQRCRTEVHGASRSGGTWTICPVGLTRHSVVYSLGVGVNISFDLSLIRRFGMTVHAFDPTPISAGWVRKQTLPPEFVLHEYGVSDYDGAARFAAPSNPRHVSYTIVERAGAARDAVELPVRSLPTIMGELGHERIDILKMDIEGTEYCVINDLLRRRIPVGQLLVEFHHRFETVGLGPTRTAMRALMAAGYRVFAVSAKGREYSLIKGRSGAESTADAN